MPAPVIGLTTRNTTDQKYGHPLVSSPKTYLTALIQTGAIPILIPTNLPPTTYPSLLRHLDGILFTGGGDIDIQHFNGEPHSQIYGIDPERDAQELALARMAASKNLPMLGICRGFQVINVALGGTLYTHILDQLPDALDHAAFPANPPDFLAHPVQLVPGTKLARILGEDEIMVNSLHHQGAKLLAPRLVAAGYSPDGLVEAFEIPDHPFGVAVQWHPEWMPGNEIMQRLFGTFIEATIHKTVEVAQ